MRNLIDAILDEIDRGLGMTHAYLNICYLGRSLIEKYPGEKEVCEMSKDVTKCISEMVYLKKSLDRLLEAYTQEAVEPPHVHAFVQIKKVEENAMDHAIREILDAVK